MNILYLHQYFKFPDETGGTRSYDLAKALLNNNLEVEILTSTSDEKLKTEKRWNKIEKDGLIVHYTYIPYGNQLSYLNRVLVFLKFLWYSSFKLISVEADVILATSTPLTIGIPALIKKMISGTKYIFEVRDVWPEAAIAIGAVPNKKVQKVLYKLEKLIYKHASTIVPLSSDMKSSIVSRYPSLKSKIPHVIENISEVHRFQTNYNPSVSILEEYIGFIPRFTILYAGTFGKVNGIDYVIRLAEKTLKIDDSIVFVLVGNGNQKDDIIEMAKEKDVYNRNVYFLEPIPKSELPQFYFEVDMGSSFVINIEELWRNSANKFFDTLAAGKPILINHKGWQAQEIITNNIGYVLPSILDDKSIFDFVKYTQNLGLHAKQKINSLDKALESYSLDIATQKYLSIFHDIIKE